MTSLVWPLLYRSLAMGGASGSLFPTPEALHTENATMTATTPSTPIDFLEWFLPGFSQFTSSVQEHTNIDLNLYIQYLLPISVLVVCWSYVSASVSAWVEKYFMSVVDIRNDDEVYNIMMAWVASQGFSQGSRKFVANTKLSSRNWYMWRWDEDEDEEDDDDLDDDDRQRSLEKKKKKKDLSYTPSMGKHYFWYRGRLLIFRRTVDREQSGFMMVSEREEISISCYGRNPQILKDLLLEAREKFLKKDEYRTQIYRGVNNSAARSFNWQQCMSRASRPFSTVILGEKTKKELIDDISDYLNPATRRWYANRGIPYRRGYLLHGPPGTGKSSLSLAVAGLFAMRIYIVSLNSVDATEEALADLFAQLPRRCVVLLEDIDTAGLTHTREENAETSDEDKSKDDSKKVPSPNNTPTPSARLSLSGLLNILDGVASQEGRVLIMTTNHVEKLDKALIRPGRVDMIIKFGLADANMTKNLFHNIFVQLEGEDGPSKAASVTAIRDANERKAAEEKKTIERTRYAAMVDELAEKFAARIPAHEFSPAELQGHLMRHKHDPQRAVDTADEFVEKTRKDHKEKERKAAEEKRKAEAKKVEEAKEKEEKEKKEAEEEAKKKEEEEVKKKVEEEIQKRFGDEIRKRVEDEMKKKNEKKTEEGAEKKEESGPAKEETGVPKIETTTTTISPLDGKLVVDKGLGHARQDSGYATPSSGEP
ncbi:BCS1 N terminal-domain-containing protein [Poronia punctata]|nr:BCS1 N terminal-domain-containing protein [Poronia punctata]